MAVIYIDADNAIVGRVGTYVAKRALLGDTIKILNSEKAVISGSKQMVIEKYHRRRKYMGKPTKGPFYSKLPDRFLRRVLRGMLPYKKTKGQEAFKRIMCYIGIPTEFKEQKLIKLKAADAAKLKTLKRTYISEICNALSGK